MEGRCLLKNVFCEAYCIFSPLQITKESGPTRFFVSLRICFTTLSLKKYKNRTKPKPTQPHSGRGLELISNETECTQDYAHVKLSERLLPRYFHTDRGGIFSTFSGKFDVFLAPSFSR